MELRGLVARAEKEYGRATRMRIRISEREQVAKVLRSGSYFYQGEQGLRGM